MNDRDAGPKDAEESEICSDTSGKKTMGSKASHIDQYPTNLSVNSLLGEILNRTQIISIIVAFLAVVSLHSVCFSLQVTSAIANTIDAVFVANVAFRFSMLMVVLLFLFRFGPLVLERLIGFAVQVPIRLWMFLRKTQIIFGKQYDYFLEPEHLRRELVLIEKIEELIDSAEPVQHYLYLFLLLIMATWAIYLDLASIFSAVVVSLAVSLLCEIAVATKFRKVSFVRRPDYRSVWYGRESTGKIPLADLYSKDKRMWSLLFGSYVVLSVFSASTGILRYSYLLNLPPVQAQLSNDQVVTGNYIGSTADGILMRNCKNNQVGFISYNGLLRIENIDLNEKDTEACSKHSFSLFGI